EFDTVLNDLRNLRVHRNPAQAGLKPLRSCVVFSAALCAAAILLLSGLMNAAGAQSAGGNGDVLLSLHSLTPSANGEVVYSLSSGSASLHILPVDILSGRGARTVR